MECIEEYIKYYGEHFTWGAYVNEKSKGRYYTIAKMPSIQNVVAKHIHPDDQIEWYCASGERDEAPEYALMVFTNRGWEGRKTEMFNFNFSCTKRIDF